MAVLSLRGLWDCTHPAIKEPTFCKACTFIFFLSFMLSLPFTVFVIFRMGPAVSRLNLSLLDDAANLFPAGVELLINGSSLQLRPTSATEGVVGRTDDSIYVCWTENEVSWCADSLQLEPIRIELPPLLYDACFTDLPAPVHFSPVRLFTLASRGVEALLFDEGFEGFPPLVEFEAGEKVEVLHGAATLIWAGGWRPAVVTAVHPARDVRYFGYTCLLDDGSSVRKRADHMRRRPTVVLAHDDTFDTALPVGDERPSAAFREELRALRADAVLLPAQLHVSHGYSFSWGQYWQYRSSRRQSIVTTRQPISVAAMDSYQPWGLALHALCDAPSPAALVCSRATATRRLERVRGGWLVPLLFSHPYGAHLWLSGLSAFFLGW